MGYIFYTRGAGATRQQLFDRFTDTPKNANAIVDYMVEHHYLAERDGKLYLDIIGREVFISEFSKSFR